MRKPSSKWARRFVRRNLTKWRAQWKRQRERGGWVRS